MNVAWPDANGPRHSGHVAGCGVPSDVYARDERMKGNDVLRVSATDEHGTPSLVEADKEGVSAQELANRYNRVIAEDLCVLGLSYELFTRTITIDVDGSEVVVPVTIRPPRTVSMRDHSHERLILEMLEDNEIRKRRRTDQVAAAAE